jgi:hypothetical protein
MSFVYVPRPSAWANRAGQKFDGEVSPTAVEKFLQPAFVETRRAYIQCASCGHWRCQHCTKRKLKPGQTPTDANWKGFVDDEGQIQPCSHTTPDARPYACSSSACAAILGTGADEQYCPCPKFVSPNTKKRTIKAAGFKCGRLIPREDLIAANQRYLAEQAAQAGPVEDKAAMLLEVAAETDLTALTPAQIAEFTGMSTAWVRKTLRAAGLMAPAKPRKSTAFVTGGSQ